MGPMEPLETPFEGSLETGKREHPRLGWGALIWSLGRVNVCALAVPIYPVLRAALPPWDLARFPGPKGAFRGNLLCPSPNCPFVGPGMHPFMGPWMPSTSTLPEPIGPF